MKILMVLSFLTFVGCSSNPKNYSAGEIAGDFYGKAEFDDKRIESLFNRQKQLKRGFVLAINFQHPQDESIWFWDKERKEKITKILDRYVDSKLISKYVEISPTFVERATDIWSVREGAARYGAEAVMIVSGSHRRIFNLNSWAWTYVALIPAFFVNGNDYTMFFSHSALIFDTRNEFLYLSAASDKRVNYSGPVSYNHDDKVKALEKESLIELEETLNEQLKKM
ncbi:MAG: hypothetical protein JNM93_13090 [Bacteriovoracaceae bacterium]|nr:hypothetical protein [Bacteriovoracaceae bacterium]